MILVEQSELVNDETSFRGRSVFRRDPPCDKSRNPYDRGRFTWWQLMTLYFRGMAAQNEGPKIGRSTRCLGIRPGIDIDVAMLLVGHLDSQGHLLPEAERSDTGELVEVAIKNGKGMSVSSSIAGLPPFRKPAEFGGTGRDPLWQIDVDQIPVDIEPIQDGVTHVSLCPRATMLLERYEAALAATRLDWHKVTEDGMDI
jgi:hypothetical protein